MACIQHCIMTAAAVAFLAAGSVTARADDCASLKARLISEKGKVEAIEKAYLSDEQDLADRRSALKNQFDKATRTNSKDDWDLHDLGKMFLESSENRHKFSKEFLDEKKDRIADIEIVMRAIDCTEGAPRPTPVGINPQEPEFPPDLQKLIENLGEDYQDILRKQKKTDPAGYDERIRRLREAALLPTNPVTPTAPAPGAIPRQPVTPIAPASGATPRQPGTTPTAQPPGQPPSVIPAATPPAGSGCPGLEVDGTFKPSPPGQAAFKCVGKRGRTTNCSVAGGAGLSSGVLGSIDEFCGMVTGCRCSIEGKEVNVPTVLACLKSLAKTDKPEKCWTTPTATAMRAGIIPLGAMPAAPNLKLEGSCVRDLHTNTLRCPSGTPAATAPIPPHVPPPVVAIAPPLVHDVPVPPNADAHTSPGSSEGHAVPVPPKVKKQAKQPRRPVNRGVPAQNQNDAATAAAVIGIIGAIAAGVASRPRGPSGGHATPAPRRGH
ncbi:MAG: hypothetical protein HY543_08485 [Deltaproteobacteria bacterium]|nr:hypothetical protein [Deltaproteobacteria bacterium]